MHLGLSLLVDYENRRLLSLLVDYENRLLSLLVDYENRRLFKSVGRL